MKRAIYALLFALLIPAAHGSGQNSSQQPTDLEAKVDAYVRPYLEIKGFSGSILIASKGRVLLRKGYGMEHWRSRLADAYD